VDQHAKGVIGMLRQAQSDLDPGIKNLLSYTSLALVAQWTSVFATDGWEFESLRVRRSISAETIQVPDVAFASRPCPW
jgi:hypothetical protein